MIELAPMTPLTSTLPSRNAASSLSQHFTPARGNIYRLPPNDLSAAALAYAWDPSVISINLDLNSGLIRKLRSPTLVSNALTVKLSWLLWTVGKNEDSRVLHTEIRVPGNILPNPPTTFDTKAKLTNEGKLNEILIIVLEDTLSTLPITPPTLWATDLEWESNNRLVGANAILAPPCIINLILKQLLTLPTTPSMVGRANFNLPVVELTELSSTILRKIIRRRAPGRRTASTMIHANHSTDGTKRTKTKRIGHAWLSINQSLTSLTVLLLKPNISKH